jgi:VWFA-related protein
MIPAVVACMSIGLAAQQQSPVFRGGTDLVEVDVVVRGEGGRFVSDLSPDDFTVVEGGEPQRIEQFDLHVSDATSLPPGATRRPAGTTPAAGAARIFIVVFDDRHLTAAGFKRTQSAAEALFARQFRSGDIGGVVVAGRMVNDRLTTNREELLQAVRTAHPSLTSAARVFDLRQWPRLSDVEAIRIDNDNDATVLDEAIRRACADDPSLCRIAPDAVRAKAQQLAAETRAESAQIVQILASTLKGLARFEGRKSILLMSEGFIAEETWPLVADAVGLAARVNARIYSLDARGLDRSLRSVLDVDPGGDDANARMLEQMDFGADSINSLAVDTGGFVIRNTNQFDKAIDRIGDDANNYYVLAYRPNARPDGKFHSIRVTVKRRGVSVRARRGYVAAPRLSSAPVAGTAPETEASARSEPPVSDASDRLPDSAASALDAARDAIVSPGVPDRAPAAADGAVVPPHVRPRATENVHRLAPSSSTDKEATDGWNAFQRGDVDTAYARLSAAAARSDAEVWVHYTLGISSYALARYKDASDAWEHVRAGAADFEPVYFDLIDAYLQQRDFDRAIRIARGALDRWPQDAEIYQALGVVQTVRGSLDDAIKSFQSAVSLAPGDPNAYFNLGKAMELRYFKSRRYVDQLRRWVSNEKDRAAAIENYQRHVDLHGVYADAARAGLQRLQWVPTPK